MEQQGFTLWLTGLSCSGKTTISQIVSNELRARGLKIEVLDGDVVRTNLSKGLGFSKEDRDLNILRVGFVAKLLTRNGVATIVAAISPYRLVRDQVRLDIGNFVEVFVKCPIEVCIDRDVKGLYKKALAGEIKNYTGIDDPYEEPTAPEVVVETNIETPQQSAAIVIKALEHLGYIKPQGRSLTTEVYSVEEEEAVKKRLEDLGYL
jgi:adenylylsulfate kinase